MQAARDSRLHAYVVLSVMTGLRTEELRALRWCEVDLDACTVAAYRSVRITGDTKTFVSLLSFDGMPLEDIADPVGHRGTSATETVYR